MDGVHDMGGMHGFGPVPYAADEPAFHAQWEQRVWGLMFATTPPAGTCLDGIRYNLERIPPHLYLNYSYYERWLHHLITAMIAGGLLTLDELATGQAATDSPRRHDAAGPESVDPYMLVEYRRAIEQPPRFQIGDTITTANPHPAGHIRLPRYARARHGEITLHHGAHVLPDTHAVGDGESPTHLYTVRFSATELWGEQANPNDSVYLDVWECHLAPA